MSPAVEVVITGPDSPAAPVRLTSEVVRQLIDKATAAGHPRQLRRIPDGHGHRRSRRCCRSRRSRSLILESAEKLEGGGGAHAYAKYRTYHWPLDQREPPDAKLHAKAVIIDSQDVLLTSANMTTAAYDKNIELGVLCRGGRSQQVQRPLDALIARGVLRPAR